jgi:hypothetical protein
MVKNDRNKRWIVGPPSPEVRAAYTYAGIFTCLFRGSLVVRFQKKIHSRLATRERPGSTLSLALLGAFLGKEGDATRIEGVKRVKRGSVHPPSSPSWAENTTMI